MRPLTQRLLNLAVTLILAGGCQIVPRNLTPSVPPGSRTAEEFRKFGEARVLAVRRSDHAAFLELTGNAAEPTPRDFSNSGTALRREFGESTGQRYLGELASPLVHEQLWAVRFQTPGADGISAKRERLFRIVLCEIHGRITMLALGVV